MNEDKVELYHGFYSEKQKNISKQIRFNNNKKYKNIYYKLYNSDDIVEVTVVFNIKTNKTKDDCEILFDDAKYVGLISLYVNKID
jgi:hypothetical protein